MRRPCKDIIGDEEDLTLTNEKQKAEIKMLRAENAKLNKRIKSIEETREERIAKAVEAAVAKATEPLLATIAEKDKEIHRLKSQLGKDLSNSSKPPGSNGYKKIVNNREKSPKKQGGQHGHKGATLVIPKNFLGDLG